MTFGAVQPAGDAFLVPSAVDEKLVAAGFLDRVEVVSEQVLDQCPEVPFVGCQVVWVAEAAWDVVCGVGVVGCGFEPVWCSCGSPFAVCGLTGGVVAGVLTGGGQMAAVKSFPGV